MTIDSSHEHTDALERGEERSREVIRFVIGRCRLGGWMVSDRLGNVGGVFVSEAAARHYAFEESGGHPEQIELLADHCLEFNLRRAA